MKPLSFWCQMLIWKGKSFCKLNRVDTLIGFFIIFRYGIQPKELKDAMAKEPNINSFVIFIGSLSDEADQLQRELPVGKAFVLKDTSELPKIMETIFSSTIAQ